nr:hypothetical protein [Tanacetum cinerariifolium]
MQTQTSNTLHNAIMEAGSKDRPPMLAPVQIIRTGIDNDIYSTVDACPNACEMWKAIERLKQGESINVQDLETNLYWEFGKFTSQDGESPESYYSRFYKMMNELTRNQCKVTNHQVNVQFLLQLQPEWQRFVTLVKQNQELKTVSYHKLYDILKQHQHEVNKIRAEKIARIANPLVLVAQQQPNSLTRSQQAATRNREKAIVNSPQPIYDQEPSMVAEDDETSKDKEIDKLIALISLLSVGYENQRIGNVAGARETVETKTSERCCLSQRKVLLCKQEEARIQLNAEQADWRDDTDDDDELEDQELEAHYMYMAQLQEVSPDTADSGPIFDDEPLQKVSNDDHYNVFAMESKHPEQSLSVYDTYPIEQDAQNVIIASLDMSYDREEIDQNDDDNDLANERELLASFIEKLKCEIDESKHRNKILETSNKVLIKKLKDEIEDFKNKNKSLESSNNYFKEANNKLSETNNLLYSDYKKSKVELARRNSMEYVWQMEIECAKVRGDFLSYKMEYQKSCTKHTQKINDLNQTISKMKVKLSAHQETISIPSQQKEAQIKLYKTREDKELEKVIALENKVKVLDNIVYKTDQSIQMMNMLNNKCQTSFLKPEFLKKAQRANPRLYDIGCYNDNLALMLAPESDEVIRLEKESRSKLSDLIRPFDYNKLNNLYDLFVPQREKSFEQWYFSERSRLSHTSVHNGNSEQSFNKQTTLLEIGMDESILLDKKCQSSIEIFKVNTYVNTIFNGVELCKEKIANITYFGYIDPFIQKTIEAKFSPEIRRINAGLAEFHKCLNEEMVADLRYFNSFEFKVDSLRSQLETQKTQFLNEIDRLSREYYYADHMNAILNVYTELDEDKGIVISELKKLIEKLKGKSVDTKFEKSSVIRQPNAFKSQRPSVLGKPTTFSNSFLPQDFRKTNKRVSFSTRVILTTSVSRPQLKSNPIGDSVLHNNSLGKKQDVEDHHRSVKFSKNKTSVTACNDSLNAKTLNVNSVCATCDTSVLNEKHDMCVLNSVAKPLKKTVASKSNQKPRNISRKLVEIVLLIVDSGCSKHMTGNLKLLINFMEKFLGTVKLEMTKLHLFLDMEIWKSTYYIRDLNGNDLLTGSRGMDFYSITLQDTNCPNLICLMAKSSLFQAWLWHRLLSHLNFDTINLLSKNDIVVGLPKLKFIKDNLCSSCELGKAKRKSFHTKLTSSSKRRLQLLHMDLCGPMRALHAYFAAEEILHQTSVARTPEQNSVVKRRNHTLVEAARTMLNAAKVPLFFWTEAIATACFTQNQNGTMALEHVSLSPAIQRQANVPHADRTVTTSNELDLLFSPMFDELLNETSNVVSKSFAVCSVDAPNQRQHHTTPLNNHTTPAPTCQVPTLAPTVTSSKNINQAETHLENDQVADDEFINIFCTPVQNQGETSSRHVDSSNMYTFCQRYPSEHRWTKDHPLEQVIGNPSQSVKTRRQLESDAEMCVFALTVSRTEHKNIKEAMADSTWIESMQEELHQFDRLDVWELVDRPLCTNVINLKWLWKNKRDEENTVIQNKSRLVAKGYAQKE